MPQTEQERERVIYATVRESIDPEWLDIECRFASGEKYVAVQVDAQKPDLAQHVAALLGTAPTERGEREQIAIDAVEDAIAWLSANELLNGDLPDEAHNILLDRAELSAKRALAAAPREQGDDSLVRVDPRYFAHLQRLEREAIRDGRTTATAWEASCEHPEPPAPACKEDEDATD